MRQDLAAKHFALVNAEMKCALADLPFLRTCANAEPSFRAEHAKIEEPWCTKAQR